MSNKLQEILSGMEKCKQYFISNLIQLESPVQIYTHIDTDGIASGAILGKALYRENLPFQITVLRQLEREEIISIFKNVKQYNNFIIFSDFGSGQYLELQKKLSNENGFNYIILDHHLPQNVANKEEIDKLKEIQDKTRPWHMNPYFFGVDGSIEISGSGMSYLFAKCLNENNIDLSPIAITGATGDIQNQGKNRTFTGINLDIVADAKKCGGIEIVNDLNFEDNCIEN